VSRYADGPPGKRYSTNIRSAMIELAMHASVPKVKNVRTKVIMIIECVRWCTMSARR
jgi:hypothetical protein